MSTIVFHLTCQTLQAENSSRLSVFQDHASHFVRDHPVVMIQSFQTWVVVIPSWWSSFGPLRQVITSLLRSLKDTWCTVIRGPGSSLVLLNVALSQQGCLRSKCNSFQNISSPAHATVNEHFSLISDSFDNFR